MRNLVRRLKAFTVVVVLGGALFAVVKLMVLTATLQGYLIGLSN